MNPLVCFGNVYDNEQVIEGFNNLPCDKLRMDYVKSPKQFLKAQEFFLNHKEYTHFVYLAPDLIINNSQFQALKQNVKDNKVYGPILNVNKLKYYDKIECCVNLPTLEFFSRQYRWIAAESRIYFLEHNIIELKVKYNALAFCFIKRKILENYKFTEIPYAVKQKPLWEAEQGYAVDLAFCHYCDFKEIDLIVNLNIKLKHANPSKNYVGIKKEKIEFIKWQK